MSIRRPLLPLLALPLLACTVPLAGCHDRTEDGRVIDGNHRFEGKGEFKGVIKGDATVAPGADLVLKGIVGGNVVVEEGARLKVKGIVGGRIINNGGRVDVQGIVKGD